MAKQNKTVDELAGEKLEIIRIAGTDFTQTIKERQKDIFDQLVSILNSFDTLGGKIDSGSINNQQVLTRINRVLNGVFKKDTFKSDVSKYLKNFDDFEKISKKLIETENKLDLSDFDLSTEKKLAVEELTNSLLSEEMLNANLGLPVKKIMYRQLTTGMSLVDAQNEIRNFIIGTDTQGALERYTKFLAQESLSRYDGMINQKVMHEFKLDGFRIVGSLIKTSAISCIEMIKSQGALGAFSRNGKYRVEDLPKIIEILSNRPGFVAGTNPGNYFINRNHYGCRHVFIPTRLLQRDKDAFSKPKETEPVVISQAPKETPAPRQTGKQPIEEKDFKDTISSAFQRAGIKNKVVISSDFPKENLELVVNHVTKLLDEYRIPNKTSRELSVIFRSNKSQLGYVKAYGDRLTHINMGHRFDERRGQRIATFKSLVDPENLPLSTTTHEFAHFVAMTGMRNTSEFMKEIEKKYFEYKAELRSILRSKSPDSTDKLASIFLGDYSTSNSDEFLAEAFTEYKLRKNPSKYAKIVGTLFDQNFKK